MPANTSRLALTYQLSSDPPNGAELGQTMADQLDAVVGGFYSGTLANRSTVVPTPSLGMQYYATDVALVYFYAGSAWAVTPGTLLGTTFYNPGTLTTWLPTSNTTTIIDSAGDLNVAFIVPPSGDVIFTFNASMSADEYSGGMTGIFGTVWDVGASAEVNSGLEGALLFVPTGSSSVYGFGTYSVKVTGLTPGASKTWAPGQHNTTVSPAFYAGGGLEPYSGPMLVEVKAA